MSEYGEDVVKAAQQAFQSPTTLVYKRRVKHVHYVATRAADELFRSPTALVSKRSMRSVSPSKKSREKRIRDLLDPRSSSPLRSSHSNLSSETMPYLLSDSSRCHSSVGRRYQSLIQNADQKALFHQMQNSLVVKLRSSGEKNAQTSKPRVEKQQSVYCGGCPDIVLSRHSETDDDGQVPDNDDSDNSILMSCNQRHRQQHSPKRRREISVSFDESSSWSTKSTKTKPPVVQNYPSFEAGDSVFKSRKNGENKLSSYARFFSCIGAEPSDSPKHEPMPTLIEDGFDDAICDARSDPVDEGESEVPSKAESFVESNEETREEVQDTNRSSGTVERMASPIITASSVDGQQVEMSIKPSFSMLEDDDGSQGVPCATSSDVSTAQSFQSCSDVDEEHSSEHVESVFQSDCDVDEKPSSEEVKCKSNMANPPDVNDMPTSQSFQSGCDVDENHSSKQVDSHIRSDYDVDEKPLPNLASPPDGNDMPTGQSLRSCCDIDEKHSVEHDESEFHCGSIVDEKPSSEHVESKSNVASPQELLAVQQRPSIVDVSSIDSPVGNTAKTVESEGDGNVEVNACSNDHTTSVQAEGKQDETKDKESTFQFSNEEVGRFRCAIIDTSMESVNYEIKNAVSSPPSEPPVDQQKHPLRSFPSDEFSPRARDQSKNKGSRGDTRSAKASTMLMSKAARGESMLEVGTDDLRSDSSQESSVTLKAGSRSCTPSVGNSMESTPKGGSPKTGTPRTSSSSGTPRARTPRSGTSRPRTLIEPWINKDGRVEDTDDNMQLVLEVPLPTDEAVEVEFSPESRVHNVLLSPKERDGALSPKEMEFLPALFDTRSYPSNENQTSWSPDSAGPEKEKGKSTTLNIYERFQPCEEIFSFSDADVNSEPGSAKSISALRLSPSSSSNDASSLETFSRLVSPSSGGSADNVECDETELRNEHLRGLIQRLTALPTLADDQRPETPIPLRSYTELGITQDLPPQEEYSQDHDSVAKIFRQRDESSKNDLSFMVKAKLVSEFFRSRIVSGEGAIQIEARDRDLLEDLLHASDQLHFIESLRFRVGAVSETPTTLLQRLALRCKKLGLHRKGAKNPILATMAITDKSVTIRVDASSGEDDLLPSDSVPSSPHIDDVVATRSGSDSDLAAHLATFDRLMAMPKRSKSVDAAGESQIEQIDTCENSLDLEAFRGTLQRVSALATLSEEAERSSSPFRGYVDLGITENPTISFDLKSDITNVLEGYTQSEPSVRDLRDHDFAYLITASMLVKFFYSRIACGEDRITLKPEDRITFEQLFPHSSILNFVDTVRFRVKGLPAYPVTHVDLVTVQCQVLGLDREGSDNPIFATLSLMNEPAFVQVNSLAGEFDEDCSSPNSRTLGTYFLSVFSTDKGMISPLNSMCMSPRVRSPTAMPTLAVFEEEATVESETNRDSFQASSTEKNVTDQRVVDTAESSEQFNTPPPRSITMLREVIHETDIQTTLHNRPSDEDSADQSVTLKELEEDEILFQASSSRSNVTHGDPEGDISSNIRKTPSSFARDSSIVPSYSSDDECSEDESDDECSADEGMGSVFDDPPSISDLEGGDSKDEALPSPQAPVLRAIGSAIQDPSKTTSGPVFKKRDSVDDLERLLPFPFGSGSSEEGLGMWGYVLDSHLFVVRSEDEGMPSHRQENSICSVERGLDHIWSGVEEWRETVSPVEENEYWTWEGAASDVESHGEFWTTCSTGNHMKYRPSCCDPVLNTQRKIPVTMSRRKSEDSKNHCPSQDSDKIREEQHYFFNKIEKLWLRALGHTQKTKSAMSDESTTTSLPDIIAAYSCFQGADHVTSYTNCSMDDISLAPSRVSTAPESPWHIILPTHFTKCAAQESDFDLHDDDSILIDDDDHDDEENNVEEREENNIEEREENNVEDSSASSWSRVSYYSESSACDPSSPWKPVIPIVRCRRSRLALRKAKLGRPSLIADTPKRRRKRGVIL